jgi:hypothetical protein
MLNDAFGTFQAISTTSSNSPFDLAQSFFYISLWLFGLTALRLPNLSRF